MDTLCRVCIERAAKCTPINSKIEDSSNLSFLGFLNKCTTLNAREGDSLPQNLCSICADSMKMFYTFVKLAEKSDIILREALKNLRAKGRYKETSCEEMTIRNAKIKEEESEDFNQNDTFHCQPSRNSTGPKLYILDIVKEEPHVSESTPTVDLIDAEINEGENFESNLDHPKGSIEELDDILSCIDRRVASINAEHTDFEDEVPISLLKWKLGKNVDEADSQNNVLFEVHCIPSTVKKKADKTKADCKEVIKEGITDPQGVRGSSRLIDNNNIPCKKRTRRSEKVEENPFHSRPSENSTGSSLILDIVKARTNNNNISQKLNKSPKEEPRVSERTSIVDLKDAKINESGSLETKLNHLEKSNEEPDDILQRRDRRLGSLYTEHTDSEDDIPIGVLKRKLAKNEEDDADSQRNCCEEVTTKNETIWHACKICGKNFCSKHYLNVHMEYHKRIRQKCHQCGKEFTFKNNLQRHLKWHANPKPFNCEYCGESFARKPSYTMHVDICERRHKPQQLNKAKNDCGICDKKFSTKKILNLHMKSHKRIKCHQCGKELKHENSLSNHLKWHANPKPFVCEICNKQFSKKDYLVVHMERHMGITQKCDQCGKEFKHRCSLSRHMREHSNPKPFKCEHCGKSFSRKFRYVEHMDICKHREKAEQLNKNKPECGVCGKKFSRKDSLNQHMKNHKVITKNCDLCGKEFKDSLFLKYHMKWHDKPKSYTCENCGRPLSSKPSYDRHKRNCKTLANSFGETVTIEEPSLHLEESEDIDVKVT